MRHLKNVSSFIVVYLTTTFNGEIHDLNTFTFLYTATLSIGDHDFFSVNSRGEMEEGSVCFTRGELTLWGRNRLDFIDGSRAFLIVIVAVQVLFEQLIVTA